MQVTGIIIVVTVRKDLKQKIISKNTKKITRVKLISVSFVQKLLDIVLVLLLIWLYILEKKPINVKFVTKNLDKEVILIITKKPIFNFIVDY